MTKRGKQFIFALCLFVLVFGSVFWYQTQVADITTVTLRGTYGDDPSPAFCHFAETIGYPGFTAEDRWQCARVIHVVGSGETPPKGLKEGTP